MDNPIGRKSLAHEVPPHIRPNPEGDVFFITISCKQRGTNQLAKDEIWKAILETLLLRESNGEIQIRLVLAMPDHLRGLFRGLPREPLDAAAVEAGLETVVRKLQRRGVIG